MIKCFENTELDIALYQHAYDCFSVRHGLHVKDRIDYAQAAKELGESIMFSLALNRSIHCNEEA